MFSLQLSVHVSARGRAFHMCVEQETNGDLRGWWRLVTERGCRGDVDRVRSKPERWCFQQHGEFDGYNRTTNWVALHPRMIVMHINHRRFHTAEVPPAIMERKAVLLPRSSCRPR